MQGITGPANKSTYCSDKNIQAAIRRKSETVYDKAALLTCAHFERDSIAGKIFAIPLACTKFREFLIQEGMDIQSATSCRTAVIRRKMEKVFDGTVSFYSQAGNLPGIMCNKKTSVGQLYTEINSLRLRYDEANITENLTTPDESSSSDNVIRLWAFLIKEEIQKIPASEYFHLPAEVSLESSEKFVPKLLSKFLRLIVDPQALAS